MHILCTLRIDLSLSFEYNKCTERRWPTQMDNKTIGHRLRALRGKMDAKTVADALGISTSALFMYERGERIPRDQIKKRIAQYFGQSVEEIFFAE